MANSELIFVGLKGSVVALSSANGQIVWQTKLKGGSFVHLVLDGENLFASTQGEIFCLEPATGQPRWTNPLKGFGVGIASIVTRTSGQGGAIMMAEQQYQQDQASSSAAASGPSSVY